MRLKKTGSATRDITEETPGASEDAILVEADKAFLGYALLSLSATLPIKIEPGVHVNRNIDNARVTELVNALWDKGKRDRRHPLVVSIRRDLINTSSLSPDRYGKLQEISFTDKAEGARADMLAGNHRFTASQIYLAQITRELAGVRVTLKNNDIDPDVLLTTFKADQEASEESSDDDAEGSVDNDADKPGGAGEQAASQIMQESVGASKGKGKAKQIDLPKVVQRFKFLTERVKSASSWVVKVYDHERTSFSSVTCHVLITSHVSA